MRPSARNTCESESLKSKIRGFLPIRPVEKAQALLTRVVRAKSVYALKLVQRIAGCGAERSSHSPI